jgi:coproporphyrinogen III oxidase-like Fe-S oxidoreductase
LANAVADGPKGGGTPSTISADEIASLLDKLGDPTANELTAEFNRGRRGRARLVWPLETPPS